MLLYRGYPIEQLAEHGDFLESCYLLLYGELPTKAQKAEFDYTVTRHTMVHEQMARFFAGFRQRRSHTMAVMTGVVGALSAFYHDSTDISDPNQRMIASIRLISKMPTLAAMAYKYTIGQALRLPEERARLHVEYFLRMCFAVPCEEYNGQPGARRARSTASSSSTPTTSRTPRRRRCASPAPRAPTPSPVSRPASPACGAPAHGGANEAALKMLAEIGTVDRIPEFVKRAKDKSDPFRLMGFGHRVYKNYDPSAKIMQKTCHEVLSEMGIKDDPLLDVAVELERIALSDEYFRSRRSSTRTSISTPRITLKALGFPVSMFTVLFAVARTCRLDLAVEGDDRGPEPAASAVPASSIPATASAITARSANAERPRQPPRPRAARRGAEATQDLRYPRPCATETYASETYAFETCPPPRPDPCRLTTTATSSRRSCAARSPAPRSTRTRPSSAFMDIMPQVEGHVLVIAKAPSRTLLDTDPAVLSAMMPRVQRVGRAAVKALGADGLTLMQFSEAAGGQTVVPPPLPPHAAARRRAPSAPTRAPMAEPEALERLAARIRAELA